MSGKCRLYLLLTLLSLAALVTSQVTFSRDWTGGKRSGPLMFDCAQFARLCKHFLHDLQSVVMAPDGVRKRLENEDLPTGYEDEK